MLERFLKASNIIELIEESSNEDKTSHKALLRVVGSERAWSGLMLDILRVPEDDSDFLVSVRKEYFISDENKPSFVWVLMIWGDILQALSEIGPVLQTQDSATPVAAAPGKAPAPKVRGAHTKVTESVSTIPLPFRRGNRNDTGITRSLSNRKGVGAFVSTIQDGGM
jgi:hypothetical protein